MKIRKLLLGLFAIVVLGSLLIIASPVIEPSGPPTNVAIFGDCEVHDITEVYFDMSYLTNLECEVGLRRVTLVVFHDEPDQITISIYIDRDFANFKPVLNDSTAPSLTGRISDDNSSFKSEELGRVREIYKREGGSDFWFKGFKQVKVKISSKESYTPEDILDILAEDEELIFEYEINTHQHVKTVKFDGVKDAVKEFRKRVKSLQKSSNESIR